MEKKHLNRRNFLRAGAATGAGLLILPSGMLRAGASPNEKLNIALIGVHGRGLAHHKGLLPENVVALCDIDEDHLAEVAQVFPRAKHYVDWRKCLDQQDIDAVVICTLDHTHAFIANWAMNRGYHVYCEKPVANSVEEARLIRAKYLSLKDKIATQVGTQRHAYENFNRTRELILDGAIGELQEACAWGNRQLRRDGYPAGQGEPPKNLHYDLWLGPSPHHPYSPEYFSGNPGANCLQWNMYWDFGTGQVGDMGSHTMDLVWNAIDATLPSKAQAEGDAFNPEVSPVEMHTTFENPANDWRPAIKTHWYQGGAMPRSPRQYIDLNQIDHGAMFKGSKGYLIASFTERILVPMEDDHDFTYYTPRSRENLLEPVGNFQQQWIDACKGDLKTSCDFEYGANCIEQMLLGLVAYRTGETLEYDGATGAVSHGAENDLLYRRQYRKGWTIEG